MQEKVALIHDWLDTPAGAEKVLQAIWELYPAPLYTLVDTGKRGDFLKNADIHPSFLQSLPFSKTHFRNFLPLFQKAIEQFDLEDYSLILSSSHAVAKNIKKRPGQTHICYCHTPMRYAWDLFDQYMSTLSGVKKLLATSTLKRLKEWDKKATDRVDYFIANSAFIAERIQNNYGRKAHVIYPPVDIDQFSPGKQKEGVFITHGRLVAYKRHDILVKAFAELPTQKLLIIGEGPEEKKLKALAPKNVSFLPFLSQKELAAHLQSATAYLFAAEEDFGIAPVEAQASGLTVIAYGKGGALETVTDDTGLFFREQTPESVKRAIETFLDTKARFTQTASAQHARRFSKERFQKEFREFVQTCMTRSS